jgi:hypothetical protein
MISFSDEAFEFVGVRAIMVFASRMRDLGEIHGEPPLALPTDTRKRVPTSAPKIHTT